MEASQCQLLNIQVHNWRFQEFVAQLDSGVVVTPNVDHLIKLQKDFEFYQCYEQAEHVVCDSRILLLLSRLLPNQEPIKEQIAGSDLLPAFCWHNRHNTNQQRVFLLGGTTPESAAQAHANLNSKTESDIVVGSYSPPFGFESSEMERDRIVELVDNSGATVLAVGVGAPKQEKWILANRNRFAHVKLFMAIGATIDFESGRVKRSPGWMTRVGLEWLYRMLQEPKRMVRRYLLEDLPVFRLILKQRRGRYENPWKGEVG